VSVVVLIIVVLVLTVLEILFQLLVLKFSLPIFENRPPIGAEIFPPQPSAEAVTMVTKDGVALAGNLLSAPHDEPRGVILFCHELDSNRWSAAYYCEGLLAAGFHVLTFDFRNQGDSQSLADYKAMHWPSVLEVEDVCAAVAFIKSRPDLTRLPLGVFGISRGGSVALVAAAQCDSIQRVVSDGAYCCNEMLLHFTNRWGRLFFPEWLLRLLPKWHVQISLWLIRRTSEFRQGIKYANVERALSLLDRKPVLMISGDRDTYVFPEVTRHLHARTGQDDSTVWIVPQAKHNMSRQADPLQYDRRLIEFFSLREPSGGSSSVVVAAAVSGKAAGMSNGRPVLVRSHTSFFSAD
jgi:pimeloyl-ACP methyl ester carboxylesterase